MSSLSSQLDFLQEKKNWDEEENSLSICYPRCRQKHLSKECPLNSIEICALFEQDRPTKLCPLLPGLKVVLKGETRDTKQSYFITQKNPWKPRSIGMNQDFPLPFNYWNNMYNYQQFPQQYQYSATQQKPPHHLSQMQYPTPWSCWPPQPSQTFPQPQGRRGSPFRGGKFTMLIQQQQLQLPSNVPPTNPPL